MGDFWRLLQTTADESTFIGGTPEKGEVVRAYRGVAVGHDVVKASLDGSSLKSSQKTAQAMNQ